MSFLSIHGLSASYGQLQVLRDVSLEVNSGEIVVILGPNGAGKTSLLRAISGVVQTAGRISFDGRLLSDIEPYRRADLGIVHVPEGRGLFPYMSVVENLELGAFPNHARSRRRESLETVLQMFPILRERYQQRAGSLSGGEQQMLAIGRALMATPRLLMLDEPSLGLAPIIFDQILDTIKELNRQQLTILLVEQTVQEALSIAHRAYVLGNGSITLSGTPDELLKNEQIRASYLGIN